MSSWTPALRRHVARASRLTTQHSHRSILPTYTSIIHCRFNSNQSYLPRVLQPSLWISLVPNFLRPNFSWTPSTAGPKPWNPATWFLVMFMFIGSQAIQTIALRHDRANYVRRADGKIALLREVIEKVKTGEWKADGPEVKRALRSHEDREWEEVLKEIEDEDLTWQQEAKKRRMEAEGAAEKENGDEVKYNAVETSPRPISRPKSGTQVF